MKLVKRLNKKLKRTFEGKVCAMLSGGRFDTGVGVLYLTGELNDRNEIVRAGLMSVNKKRYTVVNDIHYTGGNFSHVKEMFIFSNKLEGESPDVLIIGGGIVGCSIARELKRYNLDVMLVEKEHEVSLHGSGCNIGMIHPGLGLDNGKLKKKYNFAGIRMYSQVCKELDVSYRLTGHYLCFNDKWLKPFIKFSLLQWKLKGVPVEFLNREQILINEPHLNENVKFALYFPTAGVICPHSLTVAYAENAAENGVKICLDTLVNHIDVRERYIKCVHTNHGRIFPKLIINAAGIYAEEIARLANDRFYSIHLKQEVSKVFDKFTSFLVNSIASLRGAVFQVIENNLVTGINSLAAGAATYEDDYVVSFGKFTKNIIHAAGIQSPGITAAPAIAVDVSKMAADYLAAEINNDFNPMRESTVHAAYLSDESKNELIGPIVTQIIAKKISDDNKENLC